MDREVNKALWEQYEDFTHRMQQMSQVYDAVLEMSADHIRERKSEKVLERAGPSYRQLVWVCGQTIVRLGEWLVQGSAEKPVDVEVIDLSESDSSAGQLPVYSYQIQSPKDGWLEGDSDEQ